MLGSALAVTARRGESFKRQPIGPFSFTNLDEAFAASRPPGQRLVIDLIELVASTCTLIGRVDEPVRLDVPRVLPSVIFLSASV